MAIFKVARGAILIRLETYRLLQFVQSSDNSELKLDYLQISRLLEPKGDSISIFQWRCILCCQLP